MIFINTQSETVQCWKGSFVTIYCVHCGEQRLVPVRCTLHEMFTAKCKPCQEHRISVIIAKAMNRYKQIARKDDDIVLWTVGTNLMDSPGNRIIIREYWGRFIRSLRHKSTFDPLMNILEAGSKGNRLHFHFIARGYQKHQDVLNIWRRITNSKSNVNYSKRYGKRSALNAFAYLAKYAAKQGQRYYFMGSALKVKETAWEPLKEESGDHEHEWKFEESNEGVARSPEQENTRIWILRQKKLEVSY